MSKITDESVRCEPGPPDFRTLCEFLRRPESYAERTVAVRVVETHVSMVFLTDRFVYKLKKPVRFDFVDFHTLESRRAACELEMKLNRRLARDVYLEILPISQANDGRLRLGSGGRTVEWIVKMRRLPDDRMLDQLIQSGRLEESDVARLAEFLADYYRRLPPHIMIPDVYRRRVEERVRGARAELLDSEHGLDVELVKRTHAAQLRFLKLEARRLDDRVCDGRIVEGHGDLRPEHINLESTPAVFDCVEFDPRLREIDVADELSFLVMECDALGAPAVGKRVLDVYCQASGDHPPRRLLAFYQMYRACLRAKVMVLRARQLDLAARRMSLAKAAAYMRLADAYRSALGPSVALIVRGPAGSGKSTLAVALADALGAEWLETDRVRRELFGVGNGAAGDRGAGFDEGRYQDAARASVYRRMLDRADEMLAGGLSIVLDGTFLSARSQAEAGDLAKRRGALPLCVTCRCPAETAKQRIAERLARGRGMSEARPGFYQLQQAEEEPAPAGLASTEIDTTESLACQMETVFEHLKAAEAGFAPAGR